jgi:hypothetical protein
MQIRFWPSRWFINIALAMIGLCSRIAIPAAVADTPTCPPQATAPTRELLVKAQQQATDRGFLWRISRDGRDSYLYGTLHAGRPEWFALGSRTEASLARTGVLALEINVMDPAVQAALRDAVQGPPRRLPAELMRSLQAAWAAECLQADELKSGPTEFRVLQLAMTQAQRQGLFPLYGAESTLLMRSLPSERPVVGLETVQTQLASLLARNDTEAEVMVRDALADWRQPRAPQILERLVRAWATNDLAALETYADWCECQDTASGREAFARLVDGRNPGMADAIERLHAGVSVFAAVGALHLVGPQGLPALLQARGFSVSRLF